METLSVTIARGQIQVALAQNIVEARSGLHPVVLLENPTLDSNLDLIMSLTLTKDVKYFGEPLLQKEVVETEVIFDYSNGDVRFSGDILHIGWINPSPKDEVRECAEIIAESILK
jgi:hypothetical protein